MDIIKCYNYTCMWNDDDDECRDSRGKCKDYSKDKPKHKEPLFAIYLEHLSYGEGSGWSRGKCKFPTMDNNYIYIEMTELNKVKRFNRDRISNIKIERDFY